MSITQQIAGPVPAQPLRVPDLNRSLWRLQLRGLMTIGVFFVGFGLWSVKTILMGAVAAPGQFVVANDVKKVQHMSGGVVSELLVHEGSHVEAGQVVLRLDPTVAQANRQIVSKQIDEAAIRRARLEAERDGKTALVVPDTLASRGGDPGVAKLVASEAHLLDVREQALAGRRGQFQERIEQSQDEITGLKAQLDSRRYEAEILKREVETVRGLYAKKLVQFARLSQVERDAARTDGQIGALISQIAETEGKISETKLQLIQIGDDQRESAMTELREIQAKEGELTERLVAAEDQLKRVDLQAPVSGTVHELAVHTVGGVLSPGQTAMEIVPVDDDLEVEARIAPTDIDQITQGQLARVKLRAGNQRMTPELTGHVQRIAADTSKDERTGVQFYTIRVDVSPEELAKAAPLKVVAGMQSEVFVETSARTPLDFLLKPLKDQLDRTFRER
ncbi:HlyD family type I secretion periplasmic adaptor subunit [Aureimonas leprariae]|uniref:Membrane fusion protein (MFP) family protein n=1 Tax=Plantimonas leprariae TaxID=2615207 RepID=A0A7V7PLZ2_9HYPH|nr:HlyD family type I secretion periplasmic adaptor subunit [Aureimonas leprariae]KAB0677702.1 HlyD family type I secretion periplasmic adaptor subunit [Aureimonas leprariae]